MPDLTLHPDLGDDRLRGEWTDLAAADPHATVFQGPRFLGVWQRVLGTDQDVTTAAVREDGRLVGLVVEATGSDGPDDVKARRFAGGTEVTDYLGPVALPEAADAVATAWAHHLVDGDDGLPIRLGGLADDTGWTDRLASAIEAAGASVTDRRRDDVAPVVAIADGFEAWLASLPGKQRQEFRRKARKLARDVGEVTIEEVDAAGIEEGLESFFSLTSDAASHKADFFERPVMRDLFRALADEFLADRTFRLHILRVGRRAAAATVSLVHGDRWGLYNSAFDPALAGYAPGIVLVTDLVEKAADEGLAAFDLLRGDEPYKYGFGAVDRVLTHLDVQP